MDDVRSKIGGDKDGCSTSVGVFVDCGVHVGSEGDEGVGTDMFEGVGVVPVCFLYGNDGVWL